MPLITLPDRKARRVLAAMVLLACARLFPLIPAALAQENMHFLVLHSYHAELPWTRGLMHGLDSVFRDSGLPLVMHVEYMDKIRHRQSDAFPLMKEYLGRKYDKVPLRVILATDDVALDFLFQYRDDLFPGVPVVFCGPNDFAPARLGIHIQITGVAENPNMRGTIDLIRNLHPKTESIAVVSDRNPASLRVIEGLLEIEDDLGQPDLFNVLTDVGLQELSEELEALPEGTPVIFHAFLRDAAGNTYPSNLDNLALLSGQSGLPFYTFKKIDVGRGAVGGAVISEEVMAEIAADMTLQILRGAPARSIPPVFATPQVYLFDYNQLQRFHIPVSKLPKTSMILNRPFSLYHAHKQAFFAAAAGLILLMGLLAALFVKNRRERQQRRRAEQGLRQSEQLYRTLFEGSRDGFVMIDLRGRITDANHAFCAMLGYSLEELKSMPDFSELTPVRWRAWEAEEIRQKQLLGRGYSGVYEKEYIRKDGTVIPVELQFYALLDDHRTAQYHWGVVRNISERKQTEAENEKLQAQLFQAQKMESVGILAGGVAHDFNNLLHAMRGNIELFLRDAAADPSAAKRLQAVIRSMDRAAALVQQLLIFSRRIEADRVRVDVNQEVKDVAQMLRRTIPKMIDLELYLAPDLWPITGDPLQIEQALLNLVNNSVDAMPDGGKLTIETANTELSEGFAGRHPGSNAGPHVLLTVSDTGCGMDKEVLGHVFDPFFTTKEVGKGTGLGLASVYGIVKAHGGHIQCYSEPGAGTTFRIYLPVVEPDDETATEPMREAALRGGGETILVVDDEREIRDLTREVLESLGYAVKLSGTGEEALEIYAHEGKSIDLVLLDLNMPGMGGRKCLLELMKLDPAVKVVIASGYTANGLGKDALASGARSFLGKPYRINELATVVRSVLDDQ